MTQTLNVNSEISTRMHVTTSFTILQVARKKKEKKMKSNSNSSNSTIGKMHLKKFHCAACFCTQYNNKKKYGIRLHPIFRILRLTLDETVARYCLCTSFEWKSVLFIFFSVFFLILNICMSMQTKKKKNRKKCASPSNSALINTINIIT